MKLNRRVQLLILPVLVSSFLVIAIGLYFVERNAIYSLNRSSAELEATELAGIFSKYTQISKGFLASLTPSDALRNFLASDDEQFKSLALSSSLDGLLNNLADLSADYLSITLLRRNGSLEYYYENSLDPFSSPDPQLLQWAENQFSGQVHSATMYFVEKQRVAYCHVLDRITLNAPLDFNSENIIAIVVAISPSEFINRSDQLADQNRTISFRDSQYIPSPNGPFEARRQITGFGSISVEIDRQVVDANLTNIFRRLAIAFLALTVLTYIVLQWLLSRYVIEPINRLEHQLSNIDLNATEEIAIHKSNDEIGNLSATFSRLYNKLKETHDVTRELAERDSLTTLYNRRIFNLTLQKLLTRAERSGTSVALLYIDIDNFKYVNDQFGHTAGDALLRTFAFRLHDVIRASDIILEKKGLSSTAARLAGDEFAVILHGYNKQDVPGKVARRVLNICQNGFTCEEGNFPISLSIGVASYPHDGTDAEELIMNADAAMYQSKRSGKNSISFYSEELAEPAKRQQSLELHLKQLDTAELELYYMPIVDAEKGSIICFEALLRWFSKTLGQVSPAEFVPIAESLGVYRQIDLWVIERAFAESEKLKIAYGEHIRVSINISAAELSQNDFVSEVFYLADKYQISPSMFTFEITETFYQNHASSELELLHTLNKEGFQLAIDDLGSGFSSLLQLVEFPISMVKLDRTFVDKSLAGSNLRTLKSLVEFCHVQELKVTAEGVENEADVAVLRQAGCDFLQGFYFSEPLPISEIISRQPFPVLAAVR